MALQNIDTQALGQLISAFRALQQKDSITPEALGSLLQSIADLVATSPTLASAKLLDDWASALKSARSALVSVAQSFPDRNVVNLGTASVNLATGTVTSALTSTVISQATTDRAGVMRASHVSELYDATRNVTALQTAMDAANRAIADIESRIGFNGFAKTRFSLSAEDGVLRISGANALLAAGYVPYVFRCLTKQNAYNHMDKTDAEIKAHGRPPRRKGWNVFGTMYFVKIMDGALCFSTVGHKGLSHAGAATAVFSTEAKTLVETHIDDDGNPWVNWGKKSIAMFTQFSSFPRPRKLKLRFAIGFAPPVKPGRRRITTADLVSELVEFNVNYHEPLARGGLSPWVFSHP